MSLASEVKMTISGEMKGSASIRQRLTPDGSKSVQISMSLTGPDGRTVNVLQESVYTAKGEPTRKLQRVSSPDGKLVQTLTVTFDAQGASVTMDQGGSLVKDKVARPKGSTAASSEFWLVRDVPTKGQKLSYLRFDMSRREWISATAVYRGVESITVAGKKVQAHLIEFDGAKNYLDAKGNPLRIVQGRVIFERAP